MRPKGSELKTSQPGCVASWSRFQYSCRVGKCLCTGVWSDLSSSGQMARSQEYKKRYKIDSVYHHLIHLKGDPQERLWEVQLKARRLRVLDCSVDHH